MSKLTVGDRVLLRYAPCGSSGVVTALNHGKAQVRWGDLELTTKHSPESLVVTRGLCGRVRKGNSMVALIVALFFTPYWAVAQSYQIGQRSFAVTPASGAPTLDGSICVNVASPGTVTCTTFVSTPRDTVVVGGAAHDSGTLTVTDSNGKTYTQISSTSDPVNPSYTGMYYLANSASGSLTVTVTNSAGTGEVGMWIQSVAGASTTAPLDSTFSSTFVTASTGGTVANGSCGTARTPSQANTLIFSYGQWDNVTPTVGSGYTLLNTAGFQYVQTQSQTTATSTTGAWVSAADDWLVICAGFHP